MPKVVTAGARPGRLRAGSPDEREGDLLRSREVRRAESDADASASATAEQRVTPSERLGSPDAGAARERGPSQNPIVVSPEPVNPDSVRRRNAFQTGSRELARFLRQNGEAFAQAQEAAEGDASGFAQAWMEDFDHRAGEVFNRIPSEVRALFGNDFEALRAESFAEADSFERDRRILAIRQGITSTRQEYLKLVGQEPARLDYAFQKMEEMIRASGLRPDLIEEEVLAARRAIFASYRQARLAGPNPESLLREMEAGRFEGIVPPEEMEALVVQTAAEVGQRQRAALMERQVDADTRQRLELQRLRAGEGGDPHITPDALREIFPGEVGERKARHLESERRRAEVRAQTALMTPAEIEAAFGAFESDSGTKRDVPDDTLAGGQGDETLAGDTGSDRVDGDGGADTLAGQSSDAEPGADHQESDESTPAGRGANPVKGPEEQGIDDNRKSFEEDPAGHVLKHSPEVVEAFAAADALDAQFFDPNRTPEERAQLKQEAIRQRQFAIGLSLERQRKLKDQNAEVRVLSNAQATDMVGQIQALPYDQQVARWRYMANTYGPYADRVLNELMAAELRLDRGGTALLIFSGAPQEAVDGWGRAFGKSAEELGAKISDSDLKLIEDGVIIHGREVLSALIAGGREEERDARFDLVLRLALALKAANPASRPEEVVEKATQAFLPFERVSESLTVSNSVVSQFADIGGADAIKDSLHAIQKAQTTDVIDYDAAAVRNEGEPTLSRENEEELYADHVRSHGRWRNTCDGVQLVDGGGRPVRQKDGSFVTRTWEQLKELAEERRNSRLRRAARRPIPSEQQGASSNTGQVRRSLSPRARKHIRRTQSQGEEDASEHQAAEREDL